MEGALRKYRGHLIEGKLEESASGVLEGFFTVELDSRDDLPRIGKALRGIPSVVNIRTV